MGTGLRPYFFRRGVVGKQKLSPVSTGPTKDNIMNTNFSAPPKKASAANFKIRQAPTASKSESATMFGRLSALLRNIAPGTNKNDRVTTLIAACIAEGKVTRKEIIGIAVHFGFKRYHVAQFLEYGTGHDPESGHWRRNPDGSFSLFA